MRTSSIRLRANARLAILHEDYLEICDGNMLAAMLLSVLVYWTDIKIAKKEENRWVWKTHEDFQEDLLFNRGMKAPHRTTISNALDVLKAKDFIQWRKNPKLALDRTRQYLVNLEEVQAAIDRLPAIVSRKTDNGMSENRHSTEQATEANPSSDTNVGNTTYDESRNTDNALSEKQHCNVEKPTSNTRDYSTEITVPEITEDGIVTSAIAESDAPAPIDFTEQKKKRDTEPRIPAVSSHSQADIGNDDVPTEKRAAVKIGANNGECNIYRPGDDRDISASHPVSNLLGDARNTNRTKGAQQQEIASQQTIASSGPPDAAQRTIVSPQASNGSARSNGAVQASIPKRPRGKKPLALPEPEIPIEALRIMDDWDSIFKRPSPRTDNHIKAAISLIASQPTKEDLNNVRKFCFSSNPEWYRNKGVTLIDVARNFGKWQSLQEEPQEQQHSPQRSSKPAITGQMLREARQARGA